MVAVFVLQVAKDGINAQGGIGNKSHSVTRRIEELCDRGAGGIEVGWVLEADELVGTRFGFVLKSAEDRLDRAWITAERAWMGC